LLNSDSVTTKNSPLWKTNVKQQMGYLQVKNWARLYCPAAILGVYTADELMDNPSIKDINPAPARSRNGADVAQQAKSQGQVIDQAQEERRTGLITALEAFAKKGTAAFTAQWRAMGKANRDDAYLVGQDEYSRLLTIAENADQEAIDQSQPAGNDNPNQDFIDDMNNSEGRQ
jgi:type II secretory pathway pseudopilin PulG